MGNTVKLVNGSTIQVRTGVIQGIGPTGPRGAVGEPGPTGDQGRQGEQGPMGQIFAQMSRGQVTANNPIAANADTVITFQTTALDQLTAFSAPGTLSAPMLLSPGDYMLSVWLRFDDAAQGQRDVWFATGGQIIARSSRATVAGSAFYVDLTHPYHTAAGNESFTVQVRSGAATGISAGALTINRMGSGPQGIQGIQGIQGLQGQIGPTGSAGPAGSGGAAYTTYNALKP